MKARVSLVLSAALAGVAVLAACERTDRAVDPVWGKEPCGHCAMLVGDRRYAAEIVVDGERRFFDDVGCFVLWTEAHRAAAERAWVRDGASDRWLDARTAKYVQGAHTPMDFGFEGRAANRPDGVGFDAMRAAVLARRDGGRSVR